MTALLAWIAVVSLVWTPFFWCCCAPPDCTTTVTVTVRGCASALLSGVSVSITGTGVTGDSDSTNGSGVAILTPISVTGTTATLTITGPTGYQTATQSITLDCTSKSVSVTLSAASGYSCTDSTCCPAGGSAPFLVPTWPSTLYVTDPFGTITMSGGPNTWTGTATRTADLVYVHPGCSTEAPGDATVQFNLTRLTGSPCWQLTLTTPYNCSGQIISGAFFYVTYPGRGGTPSVLLTVSLTEVSSSCPPVAAEFEGTFEFTSVGGVLNQLWPKWIYGGAGTVTFTLSE
jgi:hypothetical protein